MKKYIIILIAINLVLFSCEEPIDLKHGTADPLLVVNGKITDETGPYQVTLSKTIDFSEKTGETSVENAIVVLSDNQGNSETLQHTENGVYETNTMQGVIGNTYRLEVQYNNKSYEAASTLLPISNIDTLIYDFGDTEDEDSEDETLLLFAPVTDTDQINYYAWELFSNDSLVNKLAEETIVGSDEFFGDSLAVEFEYGFRLNDTIRVEMSSITKEVYDYLVGIGEVIDNDGGLFSPPPVNPPSNISNGALGVFVASAVSKKSIIIKNQ